MRTDETRVAPLDLLRVFWRAYVDTVREYVGKLVHTVLYRMLETYRVVRVERDTWRESKYCCVGGRLMRRPEAFAGGCAAFVRSYTSRRALPLWTRAVALRLLRADGADDALLAVP